MRIPDGPRRYAASIQRVHEITAIPPLGVIREQRIKRITMLHTGLVCRESLIRGQIICFSRSKPHAGLL